VPVQVLDTAIQQRTLEQDPEIADRKPHAIEKLPEDLKSAIGKRKNTDTHFVGIFLVNIPRQSRGL